MMTGGYSPSPGASGDDALPVGLDVNMITEGASIVHMWAAAAGQHSSHQNAGGGAEKPESLMSRASCRLLDPFVTCSQFSCLRLTCANF